MANHYKYQPHPHVKKRESQHPASKTKKLNLNDKIGLAITKSVGTMWAAYAFVGLSLISLPAVIASGEVLVIVAWIAQTFLQLVLLPVIIVGQNIQAAAAEQRAIATYEDATALLHEVKQIQQHLATHDETLTRIEKGIKR